LSSSPFDFPEFNGEKSCWSQVRSPADALKKNVQTPQALDKVDDEVVLRQKDNRWLIVTLLLLSVCINYIDRGSLSVAAPVLKKEFSLSPARLGYLLSAFFWSYTVCQLFVGWLVDRYNVKWIYAGGFLIWSLAMASTGLVNGFTAFFVARLFLGIGESVFLPSASRIMVGLFRPAERGLPNALVDVGTKIGPAISILIGGFVLTHYGWKALFIWVGLASLLWLLPWSLWGPSFSEHRTAAVPSRSTSLTVEDSEVVSGQPAVCKPTFALLLARREVWGTSLGMFALGYVWVFLLTWLPDYLVTARGYSLEQMSVLGSLPYFGMAAASLGGGWLSDLASSMGGSATFVRKSFATVGLLLCAALLLPVGIVADPKLGIGLLIAACIALGLFTSNVWAITQILAGEKAAGQWTGVQNFIGNLGGVSPIVAGVIVQRTGSFFLAFAVAAGVLIVGAAAYSTLVGRVEEIEWNSVS
jgi:sugar phosphate permease